MEAPITRTPYLACPLCDGLENTEVMVADCSHHPLFQPSLARQRWVRCRQCGHIHVDGYFGPDAARRLFAATQADMLPGHDMENQRNAWSRLIETVSALLGNRSGRWLDVGFGSGSLLTTAAEYGYSVTGLDLRPENVRILQLYDLDVRHTAFEDYAPEQALDVISMADVLEHMPFPLVALYQAADLLRMGGLLMLSMPNADSFVWRVLNENHANPYWGEIEHYHNFGRKRLESLLQECGFEPVHFGVSPRYRVGMEIVARKR